jgi:hypothetical protein
MGRKKSEGTTTAPAAAGTEGAADEGKHAFKEEDTCGRLVGETGQRCILLASHFDRGTECKPPPTPETKRVRATALVDVALDEHEIAVKSQQAAREHLKLGDLKLEAESVKAGLKAREKALQDEISKLFAIIRAKSELRTVPIDRVFDFETRSYFELRLDTGAEVPGSRRALTQDELKALAQGELPLGVEKPNTAAPGEEPDDDEEDEGGVGGEEA